MAWRASRLLPWRSTRMSFLPEIGSGRRRCWPMPPPPALDLRPGTCSLPWRKLAPRRCGRAFMSQVDPIFEEYRPTLARLAYRMLGSQSDDDDVMEEAYLRWTSSSRAAVKSPRVYLHSIVTHLCIDQRKVVEERKQTYIGPW